MEEFHRQEYKSFLQRLLIDLQTFSRFFYPQLKHPKIYDFPQQSTYLILLINNRFEVLDISLNSDFELQIIKSSTNWNASVLSSSML